MSSPRLLAAITQRVDIVERYNERRDALDQAWIALLREHGFDTMPLPNDVAAAEVLMRRAKPDVLVLSGGSGADPSDGPAVPERNQAEHRLIGLAAESRLPLLAVCRGMQMLNRHLGGKLRRVEGHVGVHHDVAPVRGGAAFSVNSFHGFGIAQEDLAPVLEPLLAAQDGTIEAACHRDLPWLAIMWHPERPGGQGAVSRAMVSGALAGNFQASILN